MSESMLFSPARLGPLTLTNHTVMAPMTRNRATGNVPNDLIAEYYGQRSSAGLIVTEGTSPSPNGLGYPRIPGVFSPEQVEGWRKVATAAHDGGAKIFIQLMHTGRIGHPLNLPKGARVLGPSAIAAAGEIYTDAEGMKPHPTPEPMTDADIKTAIAEFGTAARNAVAAGADGVELHAATGYLLEQFIRPTSNQRTDGYGGSIENRARFVLEAAKAAIAAIGADKVGIRLSPYGMASGMTPYPEVDETYLALTKALAEGGLIYLHIANHAAMGNPPIPAALLASLRAAWPRTFFLGGSFDLASGQAAVDAGESDLVGIGRAFIANPDLVARIRSGAQLAKPDYTKLYVGEEQGYTDYPALNTAVE